MKCVALHNSQLVLDCFYMVNGRLQPHQLVFMEPTFPW